MTAGIQILNDWGTVQIDDQWAGMTMRHKVQCGIRTPADAAHAFKGAITIPAKAPIVFWKTDAPISVLSSQNNGDGTWTFTFQATEPTVSMIYVFDTPEWVAQNCGLEVFNAQGVKVFGDQAAPLKLVALVPISRSLPFIWTDVLSRAPGNYAVAVSDPGFRFETYYEDVPKSAIWCCGAKDLPDGARCDWTLARDGFPLEMPAPVEYPAKLLILADVTGL